jgi:DNA (cytosine-5)-methyltransferase 1
MRGTLYFEAIRIAKAKKPKLLLMENVKGLISHDKGRTLDVMAQAMSDIGYIIDFSVLNSKYFGVPQNRERIFMVGVRDDLVAQQPWIIEGTNVVAKGKRRISEIDGVKTFNFEWPEQTEVTTRLRDILETEVDDKYYLSDEKTAKLVAQLDGKERSNDDTSPEKLAGLWGASQAGSMWDVNKIAPTIKTSSGGYSEPLIEDGLPIREATKQGYAIATEGDAVNFQFPDSKTRRGRVGKQIANTLEASNINQGVVESNLIGVQMNRNEIGKETEISHCLMARDYKGFGNQDMTGVVETSPKYRIRKLTPLECWRLQGFTDAQHQTVVDAGLSDSQRYKQAGNAVTVNVIHAIGERLLPYLR